MEKAVESMIPLPVANQSSKMSGFIESTVQNATGEKCYYRLQKEFGVSLTKAYEQLSFYDFKHRMTLKPFKRAMSKVCDKLTP